MNFKTKSIVSIMFVFALVVGCFAALAPAIATPLKYNPNQDFTDTEVTVDAPESVFVGDDAQITITVENTADRGLPQVSIWVDGTRVAFYSEIAKGASVSYSFALNTAEAGEQNFDIEVWTRKSNVNYADLLNEGTVTIEVVKKEKSTEQWKADITDAITQAIADANVANIAGLVTVVNNKSYITLTIDGVERAFEGGAGLNSDKLLTIDGVTYTIVIQANGARFIVV
ncbi:MAG: hypothetical protein LBH74_04325 [Nitrososphaerota archaeon]|jgi:phenylpyruvate tautomerase PptA (4-oxalocrotonate tautomerase family)|nr:hypothetical protein [Nitrososphaerota archaeon]